MANTDILYLHKEARLNLEPAFPGSTIAISLPNPTTSTFLARPQQKRTIVTEKYIDQDEDSFARRHLASEASIYFRRIHKYPRTFLWRILDDRKVLEIQSIDLSQDYDSVGEANLTLLLSFPEAIRPFGVAFAEPEDGDALNAFVLTTSNYLYTLNLHRDFFIRPAATEIEAGDWCKTFLQPQFGIHAHAPYRLVATSANELLISQIDGGVMRMWRKPGDDGSVWQNIGYRENNWSLKSLVAWKGNSTVRFNNCDLQPPSAAAIDLSPDGNHIFTVCLNHTLRAWNVSTGKSGLQTDLLGENDRDPQKASQYFIGPAQPTLMKIVNIQGGMDGALYYVVTYSPKRHQFKFWGIKDADDTALGISDVQPYVNFIPPVDELMDTTVWNLEEFHVKATPGWRATEIWIRARSGPSSKIYSIKFDLHDDEKNLEKIWKNEWISVDSGPLTVEGLRLNPANPGELDSVDTMIHNPSVTDRWLDFLFFPGRFTVATLETALYVYRKGLGEKGNAQFNSKAALKERLCVAISSNIALRWAKDAIMDQDEFESQLGAQWQMFYGLVKDLHKRRGETLSLVYDHNDDTPWLLLSDYVSPIRKCSEVEILCANRSILTTQNKPAEPLRRALENNDSQDIAKLLNGAYLFRKSFPALFKHQFDHAINHEILQSQLLSVPARIEAIDQSTSLCAQVTDEDLTRLADGLGLDFEDLTNELFFKALQRLGQEEQGRSKLKKQVTRFGLNALTRMSQELLEFHTEILLDLLVLVIFMSLDIAKDELSDEFEASELFVDIINQLKDYSVLKWLASTVWSRPVPTGPSSDKAFQSLKDCSNAPSGLLLSSQTVLEGICGKNSFDFSMPRVSQPEVLTYWARIWTSEPFRNQDYANVVNDVIGVLLSQKEFDLASDFSKFLPESNWGMYLRGRLCIARGEYTLAATYFKRAAYKLGLGMFSIDTCDSINLLSLDERDCFSEGLSRYYQHVLSLFEKAKAQSFTAEFAKLGLQSLTGEELDEVKTDLLSRLFSASIQTSRFDDAYSALTRYTDPSLRKSALATIITTMVAQSRGPALLKFPFVNLYSEVDNVLSSLCQKTLNLASGPPYHKILYSFRISRNDFRGAASILYERLQRLQTTSSKVHSPEDESLTQAYLMLINTLASVQPDQAWILAEQRVDESAMTWGIGKAKGILKRRVVTLDDLRNEYQKELDRIAAIENGQFAFAGGDEMDFL
ncbi:hypothetical protein K432DRAFT_305825 [Lepidopterella palustris CBS 459.81]|uniref:Uncharacterized protein n=1 Tax=Lepidopterella palustris CBS 459.81 TaxID=1314670 RepID=A0A8E2JBN8_9PEZI|nr:hypothetical protein K432DRAFT_305825 [Lepidopterella palustris CBS 459.81]